MFTPWQSSLARLPLGMSLLLAMMLAQSAGILGNLPAACAQVVADDDDDDDNNNNNNGGAAGVVIDATGVLRRQVVQDPTGRLNRARQLAARTRFQGDLAHVSKLRMVSLNRLEQAVQQAAAAGQQRLSQEMGYLAGLSRIQYVFFLPETNDVVIAGPAEPWFRAVDGTVLGIESLKPVLHLEDLAVAMRAFPAGERGRNKVIGCSIDPTQQGLQNMQNYLRQIGNRPPPVPVLVNGLQQTLGLQTVSVQGIEANTRFAKIMVAADYRMKLIGIGLEQPAVKMTTYIDAAAGGGKNAMVRWYFVPDYECVRMSEDALAMELVGQGVKLIGEDELVQQDGARQASVRIDRASQRFVQSFTRMYAEMAARVPVYAELRNMIDLSIVAAYLQSNDLYGKASWQAEFLTNEEKFHVANGNVPRQVETAVNAVFKGNKLLTPVGGGVHISPSQALSPGNLQEDENGQLHKRRTDIYVGQLKPGQWWWDAEAP